MPEKTGPDLGVKRYETLKVGESISTDRCANRSVLKPGQLLVGLHCLNQCGSDALFDLEKASELESFNLMGIARRQSHGLADRRTADCSDAREQRMSGGLTTATRRQKKSSNLAASPSNSSKNEIR